MVCSIAAERNADCIVTIPYSTAAKDVTCFATAKYDTWSIFFTKCLTSFDTKLFQILSPFGVVVKLLALKTRGHEFEPGLLQSFILNF